ncbi:hypothetical protein CRE_18563 [Caenorhabditis remanei]|uniref:Uncharacterized protein n=1 Tax=Caenorhabditis remanei TaxID=31234 RepID=E3LJU9_CAERE|nr:hypothetical protein CRE_18563 [Caenorhabditis remanei]
MRRAQYEQHVPNRIIPPQMPTSDSRRAEYERSSRILPAPTVRQPLLGDAPVNTYYAQHSAYNGPVIDSSSSSRRRGFDKGPYGEDLTRRADGRQPLLRNPRIVSEHVGGDMDIARSRSASPEVRLINVAARSVRDDRKRDRGDRNRSRRSRSRSRSHDRGDREYDQRLKSRDREVISRERIVHSERYEVPHEQIRDGIVHTNDTFYEFFNFFIASLNEKTQKSADRDVQGTRKATEIITDASNLEKDRITLPPDFDHSDREKMLHCDTTVTGLPKSIFFGSGYGPRAHYAKFSAAKDFIDKCNRIGIISPSLHAGITDWQRIDQSFKSQFSNLISKAENAIILLLKRMASENLPNGFMQMRNIPPDLIDRFKILIRMVVLDVYVQGKDNAAPVIPKILETGGYEVPPSRYRDSDMRRYENSGRTANEVNKGFDAEEIIRQKEKELKEKMEIELENKRLEMEQEIRRKILEEERAKIRAELEMEKKIEAMKIQQQQYQLEKEKQEAEEQNKKAMISKQVEDDFNKMVGKLEECFKEVRAKNFNHILEMVYGSATFKTIQLYSSTLTSLSDEQKHQLSQDLRSLLNSIADAMNSVQPVINPMSQMMPNSMIPPMMMGTYSAAPGIVVPSMMPGFQMHQQQPMMPQQHQQQQNQQQAMPSTSRNGEVHRLTLGDMRLRQLTSSEQRRLQNKDKVIAQDAKTGNWCLATVSKIRSDRVTLQVDNGTWKKRIDELYKEDTGRSVIVRLRMVRPGTGSFLTNLKKHYNQFKSSDEERPVVKYSIPPRNSMAWVDLKKGSIITQERMRNIALPASVCKMFANDAKIQKLKKKTENSVKPSLMNLSLSPPVLSPLINKKTSPQLPKDEKEILDVLIRINKIFGVVSNLFSLSLCACIERRAVDNSMCLFTYFQYFPWALIGGMVAIEEESLNKPLAPGCCYDAWRSQFLNSLQFMIPPAIFRKFKRCVDYGEHVDWCIQVVSGEDFRLVVQCIQNTRMNPMYSILWTTKPMDFDPRNEQFSNARSALIRQVEAEVKTFWTYERIGVYLKMYRNLTSN